MNNNSKIKQYYTELKRWFFFSTRYSFVLWSWSQFRVLLASVKSGCVSHAIVFFSIFFNNIML